MVLLLGALLAASVLWRLQLNKREQTTKQLPALVFQASELTQARPATLGQTIEISGTLVAPDSVTIKAKSTAQLKTLTVIEGEYVRQGQAIGTLDLTELQSRLAERRASLAAAKSALTQASTQWEANQRLAERGFLAPTAIETSRASLESAKAQVQAAESALQTVHVQLRDADLLAPISGWVQKRMALEGEKLAIEQPIASILSTERLEIHAPVAALEAQSLPLGLAQRFQIDGVEQPVDARLSRIMVSADPHARALILIWAIQSAGSNRLRPGQFAIAGINLPGKTQSLTLPTEAVQKEGGQSIAWIIQDGKLQRKVLITGRRAPDGKRIEILDGLDASAQVLAMRFDGLREGQQASIKTFPGANEPTGEALKPQRPSS